MQLKVFCCSFFFDVMLKVKHFSSDLIGKAVEGDITSCFKLCSFWSQCNVKMERQIFIKFGHDDVVLIYYKCSAIHISFLEEGLINKLRDHCYRFEKVSNDSCIQSLKKHCIDYLDICYRYVANCYDYTLEMFYLLLVWNSCSMIKLFEIALTIVIVLILILNGHDCLFSMCFGIYYISGIYFIHWVYYHFVFSKKFQKLDSDLNDFLH